MDWPCMPGGCLRNEVRQCRVHPAGGSGDFRVVGDGFPPLRECRASGDDDKIERAISERVRNQVEAGQHEGGDVVRREQRVAECGGLVWLQDGAISNIASEAACRSANRGAKIGPDAIGSYGKGCLVAASVTQFQLYCILGERDSTDLSAGSDFDKTGLRSGRKQSCLKIGSAQNKVGCTPTPLGVA